MNLITTSFGAESTAADVIEGIDLAGQRAVVTGGASGIGLETARALATAGADVTLAVRDPGAGARAVDDISGPSAAARVRVAPLDLADRASIAAFASTWAGPLDILVNNAGVMAIPELTRTADGREQQFAVNYLGPAELTLRLHGALAAAGSARVVMVSSSAHLMAPADLGDPHFRRRRYEAWTDYAPAKAAVLRFMVALARLGAPDGIAVNALHPGGIMTNLQRHLDDDQLAFVGAKDEHGTTLRVPPGWKTPQRAAATTVLLAASPLLDGVTGRYFEDGNEAPIQPDPAPGKTGVAAYALDDQLADLLWGETEQQLGLPRG